MMATKADEAKTYDYRRGYIEVVDSGTGDMRCAQCGAVWRAQLRGGGHYGRGAWTCFNCGANSKGGFGKAHSA
jgi:hypothetical protein